MGYDYNSVYQHLELQRYTIVGIHFPLIERKGVEGLCSFECVCVYVCDEEWVCDKRRGGGIGTQEWIGQGSMECVCASSG